MNPIDFGGGMVFPDRYGRDQPDGPDPCDHCEGTGIMHEPCHVGSAHEYVCDCDQEIPCGNCNGTGQVG